MFERYTEKARRVIFFARYEASQFGSPYIETEHLLLGLLREDKALTNRFLRSHASVESIRKQIEGHTTIGRDNHIFQYASLGADPQDKKYKGEPTRLEVGDRNIFREYVTVNRGTVTGNGFSCTATCMMTFPINTPVTLTARTSG